MWTPVATTTQDHVREADTNKSSPRWRMTMDITKGKTHLLFKVVDGQKVGVKPLVDVPA